MKKMLMATAALFAAGIAAQFAGILPFDLFDLQVIAGTYVLLGVLVIAFSDYARPAPRVHRHPVRAAARTRKASETAALETHAGWTYQTLSP